MIPRIGFLGVGWIGRHRMETLLASGAAEAVAVCDTSAECLAHAARLAPGAAQVGSLDEMLSLKLDAVVIATPSALHAEQAIRSLEAGVATFCQKPLGRSAAEVGAVVDAARTADRLLGLDLSYRHAEAVRQIAALVRKGALGRLFAIDLTFHNAYGPDKDWFYDPALSGGGCVIDLGVHLVDLALWILGFPPVDAVDARLMAGGRPLVAGQVEDYAVAQFNAGGVEVRLACSWRLNAGCEAVIEAEFFGDAGGARLRNVNGSFYDFSAERLSGTTSQPLAMPPDAWGGRAVLSWALALASSPAFDRDAEHYLCSAQVLDRIYGRDIVAS
ncbi:Gfo/Idh/MocA family protein [Flavisphingomonas formosensis]|uniref:Gfo/Idh/MocA family protein n=1 Tax=Flavisphingomonas formosensis TaxID=861534 RepID=UPI0012F731FC|nr:Gfo/Idh/MocA family oxidoreductase [Sphingomonas formosensis]